MEFLGGVADPLHQQDIGVEALQQLPGFAGIGRAHDPAEPHCPQLVDRDAALIIVLVQHQRGQCQRIELAHSDANLSHRAASIAQVG